LVKVLNESQVQDSNELNGITFLDEQERRHLSVHDSLLSIDTDKLFNEYCSNQFTDNSINKYENLHNDFKILLKIVESIKQTDTQSSQSENLINFPTSQNSINYSQSSKNNLIDF
jgi:hypothetical protein